MVVKMNKIYFMLAIGALVWGAYFYGVNITNAKCQIRYFQETNHAQEILIKNKKEIHENVYKTGVRDIRRILRDKYSIAE